MTALMDALVDQARIHGCALIEHRRTNRGYRGSGLDGHRGSLSAGLGRNRCQAGGLNVAGFRLGPVVPCFPLLSGSYT